MKPIIIDDNEKYTEYLYGILKDNENRHKELCMKSGDDSINKINLSQDDPREIAQAILDTYPDLKADSESKDDSYQYWIFINIEGKFANAKRQDQKGVEILFWLRCKHRIRSPVILYSFQSNQQLLKNKPENLIINSEGCYHFQLPYDFAQINSKDIKGVSDRDRLRKYLKPAFSIEKFRHQVANWWGVIQLIDVHRDLYPSEINFKDGDGNSIPYPQKVSKELDNLNNTIALFIYGHKGFEQAYETIHRENLQNDLRRINHEIDIINNKLTPTARRNPRPGYVVDLIRYYEGLINENASDYKWNKEVRPGIEEELRDLHWQKEVLEGELDDLQLKKASIENTLQTPSARTISARSFTDGITHFRHRNVLPKILLIDDQANDGWLDIFQYMLYGKLMDDNFKVIQFTPIFGPSDTIETKLNEIFSNVKNMINDETGRNTFGPDLIMLDVRLLPEYDYMQKQKIFDMSGPKLLSRIRAEYPSIPVIITTASNKVWTFEELIKLGADGYWIKEGLDDQRTEEETVINYIKLLTLIYRAAGEEYRFLKTFDNKIRKLRAKNDNDCWWKQEINWQIHSKKMNYLNNNIGNIRRGDLINDENNSKIDKKQKDEPINLLRNILVRLRSYCYQYVMNYGQQIGDESLSLRAGYLRGIVNDLGSIIELIHGEETKDHVIAGFVRPGNSTILYRGDFIGMFLSVLRNKASHYAESQDITFQNVIFAIEVTCAWLDDVININRYLPDNTEPSQSWSEIEHQIKKVMGHN